MGQNVTGENLSNTLDTSRRVSEFKGVEEGGVGENMGGGRTLVLQEDASLFWHGRGGGCSKAISQVWPSDNAINLRSRYSYTASTMFPSGPVQALKFKIHCI